MAKLGLDSNDQDFPKKLPNSIWLMTKLGDHDFSWLFFFYYKLLKVRKQPAKN